MACFISSNQNRHYAAVEDTYGSVRPVSAENRIPAVRLQVQQSVEQPDRRDKTGTRTFTGLPPGFRKRNRYSLVTYMQAWEAAAEAPAYGALMEAALGAPALAFGGGVVQSVTDGNRLQFATAHNLQPDQAISCRGEIRFVAAIIDAVTVLLNAPFSTTPAAAEAVNRTVTYQAAADLRSVSLYDYWDPAEAVQRVLAGAAVDRMRVRLNGDFHQFEFSGPAREAIDSLSFQAGEGGLSSYPAEPASSGWNPSLVPGNLGQAWIGLTPSQMFSVLDASVTLDNGVEARSREFGAPASGCLSPGPRDVRVSLRLLANTSAAGEELYTAARQRSPLPMMFQLGQQAGHLCGIYLKSVVPEVPELDDTSARLEWVVEGARAQGTGDDELVLAFG